MHFDKDLAEALPVKKEPNVGFLAKKESSHNITAINEMDIVFPCFSWGSMFFKGLFDDPEVYACVCVL